MKISQTHTQAAAGPRPAAWLRSGAAAGAFSALVFTAVHDLLISDIWSMAVIMLVAGALCGLCLGWSYGLLVAQPSARSWLGYNLLYVALLWLLGVVSVLVFEPVVSMAVLVNLDGPPHELIGQAMPLTAAFTVTGSGLISLFYRPSWRRFGAVLLTASVLVLLLGLNVSVLGLVSIPRGSLYLVVEFLGLIALLNVVFAAAFVALERGGGLGRGGTRSQH